MERYYGLLRVEATNGEPPDLTKVAQRVREANADFPERKVQA
jgi:hypothetical protein